jgi:hypothetical protein
MRRMLYFLSLPALLFVASCAHEMPELEPHYQYLILTGGELRGLPAVDFSRPELLDVKITDDRMIGGFCYTPNDFILIEDYITELEELLKDAYSSGSK